MKFSLTFHDLTAEEVRALTQQPQSTHALPVPQPLLAPPTAAPPWTPQAPAAAAPTAAPPWTPQPAQAPPNNAGDQLTPAHLLPVMQQYIQQFKPDGAKALFAKYACPSNITLLNQEQLRTMKAAFEAMQPAV